MSSRFNRLSSRIDTSRDDTDGKYVSFKGDVDLDQLGSRSDIGKYPYSTTSDDREISRLKHLLKESKREVEAKESRISDMQIQIKELLGFKEKAYNQRTDTVILEEKLRIKEEECAKLQERLKDVLKQNDEVQSTLHDRLARLEKQGEATRKQYSGKVTDLEAHIDALKQDNDRQSTANGMLQQELAAMQRAVQAERLHGQEREKQLKQNEESGHEHIARLRRQVTEQTELLSRAEAAHQASRRTLSEKEAALKELHVAVERLQAQKADQAAVNAELQATVESLQSKNARLLSETSVIPSLQSQLADYQRLEGELTQARRDMTLLDDQLEREKAAARLTADELATARRMQNEMQRELKAAEDRVMQYQGLEDDLSNARKRGERLEQELSILKARYLNLQEDVGREADERHAMETKQEEAYEEVEREMQSLAAVVSTTLESSEVRLSGMAESGLRSIHMRHRTRQAIADCRFKVIRMCNEVQQLRTSAETAKQSVESSMHLSKQLDKDKRDLKRDYEGLLMQLEALEAKNRREVDDRRHLESELNLARSEVESVRATLKEKLDSLVTAVMRAVQDSAQSEDDSHETPPSLNITSSGMSFDTLQFMLSDYLVAMGQHRERLSRRYKAAVGKSDELQKALAEARHSIMEAQEEARAVIRSAEEKKAGELERLRADLEAAHGMKVDQLTFKLQGVEQQCSQYQIQSSENAMQLQTTIGELQIARERIESLTASLESLQRARQDVSEECIATRREVDARDREIEELRVAMKQSEASLALCEEEKEQLLGKYKFVCEAKEALQRALAQRKEDGTRLNDRLLELTAELSDKGSDLEASRRALDTAKRECSRLEEESTETRMRLGRLMEKLSQNRMQLMRYWEAIKLLVRGMHPLRLQCQELLLQRRVLSKAVRCLQKAVDTYELETRAVVGSPTTTSPTLSSLRPVVFAIIAGTRLARYSEAKKGAGKKPHAWWLPRTVRFVDGERVSIATSTHLSPEPMDIPFPPPSSLTVLPEKDDDQTLPAFTTTGQEEAEGLLALLSLLYRSAQASLSPHDPPPSAKIVWDTMGLQRLAEGVQALLPRFRHGIPPTLTSPVQRARSTAYNISKKIAELEEANQEGQQSLRTIRDHCEDRNRKVETLADSLHSRESLVGILEAKVVSLQREKEDMVSREQYALLAKELEHARAKGGNYEGNIKYRDNEIARLTMERDAANDRLRQTQLQLTELRTECDQTRRALSAKQMESSQITEFLQAKAKQTVLDRKELDDELHDVKKSLERQSSESEILVQELEQAQRKSEWASLKAQEADEKMSTRLDSAHFELIESRRREADHLRERQEWARNRLEMMAPRGSSYPIMSSSYSVASTSPQSKRESPPRPGRRSPTRLGELNATLDVLSYIHKLDEKVEQTLRYSRRVDATGPKASDLSLSRIDAPSVSSTTATSLRRSGKAPWESIVGTPPVISTQPPTPPEPPATRSRLQS